MSRWIDADTLIRYGKCGTLVYWEDIENAPSIDIVRCKECKKAHLTYDGDCKQCDEWKDDDDNFITVYHDGNFYCGYGERKESE